MLRGPSSGRRSAIASATGSVKAGAITTSRRRALRIRSTRLLSDATAKVLSASTIVNAPGCERHQLVAIPPRTGCEFHRSPPILSLQVLLAAPESSPDEAKRAVSYKRPRARFL